MLPLVFKNLSLNRGWTVEDSEPVIATTLFTTTLDDGLKNCFENKSKFSLSKEYIDFTTRGEKSAALCEYEATAGL